MTKLNMPNRTLGIMDNLPFLRSINNDCVDLIAIDPPFAANETFVGKPKPPVTDAELEAEKALAREHGANHDEGRDTHVRDIWSWDVDIHPDWLSRMEDDYPPVFAVIKAVEACASENEAAYIAFMAVRLIECRRVLKRTGGIYLHCDDHANGFLRLLMDAVFGAKNFRNEIVWRRSGGKSDARRWGRTTDRILYYAKSDKFTWNRQYQPLDPDYVSKTYRYDDDDGRGSYTTMPLHAAGLSGGESGRAWRGYSPGENGNHWRTPTKGAMSGFIIENGLIPGWPMPGSSVHERLEALDKAGLIAWSSRGVPRIKTYLSATKGKAASDLLTDIPMASGNERTGYATQKPLALYERIIAASSNPGDVVLDIFAGCATTAIAAERLERRWVACDMAYRSWTMLKRRFRLNNIALSDPEGMRATDEALRLGLAEGAAVEWGKRASVLGPNDLPARGDEDPEPFHNLRKPARGGRTRKSARSASWSGRIPKDEAKKLLIDEFGAECWGCGWEAPTFPSGERDLGLLEIDHIWARSDPTTDEGGSDELYNLALLHSTCNKTKSNRMTLEQLRRQNADNQRLYKGLGDLVHLGMAQRFAVEKILMRGSRIANFS